MTPKDRVFAIDVNTPASELTAQVIHGHFSRVPVYRGTIDNIVGVLNAKDLVARRLEGTPPRIDRLMRPPYFVPARKPLGEGKMVRMRVRDEHNADRLARQAFVESGEVCVVIGTRIDDHDHRAGSDDPCVGSRPGVRTGVGRDDSCYLRQRGR